MSPTIAKRRGTRPDLYIMYPRINPFPTPTMKPGPNRNDHSLIASIPCQRAGDTPVGASCRKVATARRQMMPTAMKTDSITRAVTYATAPTSL